MSSSLSLAPQPLPKQTTTNCLQKILGLYLIIYILLNTYVEPLHSIL